ncbi:MAG: hypothetical protein H0X02_06715 [Nitrosomonas sp.]|nr:hypothetical protein [Nitrosomonas sp.]
MISCWVKLGILKILTKSEISQSDTFVYEKFGGPDRDRTDDLLHAMHDLFLSVISYFSLYVFEFFKHCLWITTLNESLNSAHICGKTQTIEGAVGGKIGVNRQVNFALSFHLGGAIPTRIISAFFIQNKTISKLNIFSTGRGTCGGKITLAY